MEIKDNCFFSIELTEAHVIVLKCNEYASLAN